MITAVASYASFVTIIQAVGQTPLIFYSNADGFSVSAMLLDVPWAIACSIPTRPASFLSDFPQAIELQEKLVVT